MICLQAYSPEIFIIPGSHDTYARPASDSNHVVIATHGYTTGNTTIAMLRIVGDHARTCDQNPKSLLNCKEPEGELGV